MALLPGLVGSYLDEFGGLRTLPMFQYLLRAGETTTTTTPPTSTTIPYIVVPDDSGLEGTADDDGTGDDGDGIQLGTGGTRTVSGRSTPPPPYSPPSYTHWTTQYKNEYQDLLNWISGSAYAALPEDEVRVIIDELALQWFNAHPAWEWWTSTPEVDEAGNETGYATWRQMPGRPVGSQQAAPYRASGANTGMPWPTSQDIYNNPAFVGALAHHLYGFHTLPPLLMLNGTLMVNDNLGLKPFSARTVTAEAGAEARAWEEAQPFNQPEGWNQPGTNWQAVLLELEMGTGTDPSGMFGTQYQVPYILGGQSTYMSAYETAPRFTDAELEEFARAYMKSLLNQTYGYGSKIAFDERELRARGRDLWRAYMLEEPDNGKLKGWVRQYIEEATSFYSQGGSLDFDSFFMDEGLRKTDRWDQLFNRKPRGMDELDYLGSFQQVADSLSLSERTRSNRILTAASEGQSSQGFEAAMMRTPEFQQQNIGSFQDLFGKRLANSVGRMAGGE